MIVRKIVTFFTLKSTIKFLLVEAYFSLFWARILKALPFSKIAPSLGIQMEETSFIPNHLEKRKIRDVSTAIHIMSNYTFWESQCLVKAIAGMKMLERRQIESTLYLGTSKDELGKMVAHAWLRSGNIYISGEEGMNNFTVVGMFAKRLENTEVKARGLDKG